MVDAINESLSSLPQWLHVFIISILPVIELRGAIPYGVAVLSMPWKEVFLISVLGSIIPCPFIVVFGKWLLKKLSNSKIKLFNRFGQFLSKKSTGDRAKMIERNTFWGIVIFVGIPLPGTGVWTGSLIASVLGLDWKKVLLSVFIGSILAGVIVLMITLASMGILA